MKKILIFLSLVVGVIFGGISGEAVAEEATGTLPEIYIKAVNPGYTVDGMQNVGEMIEIGRKNSDTPISLAGLTIDYTNSSGNTVTLADFSKYTWTAGETILLRLASSPGNELAQVRYTKTLAFKAGPLVLKQGDEILDLVCWLGGKSCYAAFSSSKPTSLVRNVATGDFEHVSDYEPEINGVLDFDDEEGDVEVHEMISVCRGVVFSEILSYYETLQSEQFIELYNNSTENVSLDGCFVKYKNKMYPLSGMIMADGYFVRLLNDFKLTKNPASSGVLELIDADGAVLDKLVYPNGQRRGTSYAFIGYDDSGSEIWKVTYAPTPGEPNNYQEFKTCEAGKVLNEATGNCVKATASISEKVCAEGQYLNILTGRCKKIPVNSSGVKECKEGYYLNEETGRCRKLHNNNGADYALVSETYSESSSFVALYLILGVVGAGLVYIIYEFRREIWKFVRRFKRW